MMSNTVCMTRRTTGQYGRRGRKVFPSSLTVERVKLRGMCHVCFSSNVPVTIAEEDYSAVCDQCLEYQKKYLTKKILPN